MLYLIAAIAPGLLLAPLAVVPTQRASVVMRSYDQDKHAGGATPFAAYKGGGSGSDQSKWSMGGDWSARASLAVKKEAPVAKKEVPAPVEQKVQAAPAKVVDPSFDQWSGGAAPFAPFVGGGSACDQTKWAQGGDWTLMHPMYPGDVTEEKPTKPVITKSKAAGVVVPSKAARVVVPLFYDRHCGGATPFAPVTGGGSASDQSKWANGGEWWKATSPPAPAEAEVAAEEVTEAATEEVAEVEVEMVSA